MANITESQAIVCLRHLFWGAQKARSNMMESWGDEQGNVDKISMLMLEELQPWLFGPRCILTAFERLMDRIETGDGHLEPADFYNIVTISANLAPVIIIAAELQGRVFPFHGPDFIWLQGWASEEAA